MSYKYFLSVCLAIKNEAKYMEEFINHYISEGVDHFYIINNNSDDNIEEVINNSIHKDNVTLITDNRDMGILTSDAGYHGHHQLLNENLYELIKMETEWAILIDADEFMYGRNGYTIKTYLQSLDEKISCIYVIWNIMNPYKDENNNLISEFSIKNNVKRINHDKMKELPEHIRRANDFGKSLFRTKNLYYPKNLWIHLVKTQCGTTINNYGIDKGDVFINYKDSGNNVDYSEENYSKANITLNHYAIRNLSDYEKKEKQLETVPHKIKFIKGLIDMVNLDDSFLITDDYLAKKNE
jgi:antitoxin component HigA of HigAB toxin-antitoxin module